MATKEDILEQIVEEYLVHKGYFVQHNIKFLPRRDHPDFVSNQDSNHSDIDVIGFHPKLLGPERIMVVSCKSWQSGFNPRAEIDAILHDKVRRGRKAWQAFRELCVPKWSEAYLSTIEEVAGSREFTCVLAVTKVKGNPADWENHQPFIDAISGNPIKILTFKEMVFEIQQSLTTTLAATEVGRFLQLFKSAGIYSE